MKKQVTEKPIIFSEKMVNAILKNDKVITRRIVEPQPPSFVDWLEYTGWIDYKNKDDKYFRGYMQPGEPTVHYTKAKYWPGLKLWVRETWAISDFYTKPIFDHTKTGHFISIIYKSNEFEKFNIDIGKTLFENYYKKSKWENGYLILKWRPSIFIPHAASRITLEIKDVTIERLHELDNSEALLEGCKDREDFIKVWDNINKKRGYPWAANPWVYRIHFKVLKDDC